MHGSLLNHMTIITEVGAAHIDHKNDDTPEVDSFFHRWSQGLDRNEDTVH